MVDFICGLAIGFALSMLLANFNLNLILEPCEQSLPRNQSCKLIAVPDTGANK